MKDGFDLKEELKKLLAVGFISELQYTAWLSNIVMVKKASGRWRKCTDFWVLKKHYGHTTFV